MTRTVLIVETDHAVRRLVGTRLRLAGITVREASNGPEGLATFSAHKEEIVAVVSGELSDVFDGSVFLDEVRVLAPSVPVFFFLGHSLPDGLYRPGVEVFLKPGGLGDLCRAVVNLVAALRVELGCT
jgi:DNA-binding NtrC family response regulator